MHCTLLLTSLIIYSGLHAMSKKDIRFLRFTGAARDGKLEEIKASLQQNRDINISRSIDQALREAVAEGHYEIVELLLKEAKARYPNLFPISYDIPLNTIKNNRTAIAQLLIQNDIQINLSDGRGHFFLMGACINENIPIIKELLHYGTHIDEIDQAKVFSVIPAESPNRSLIINLFDNERTSRKLQKLYQQLAPINNSRLLDYTQKHNPKLLLCPCTYRGTKKMTTRLCMQ
jgi:ankyrin repeat protein